MTDDFRTFVKSLIHFIVQSCLNSSQKHVCALGLLNMYDRNQCDKKWKLVVIKANKRHTPDPLAKCRTRLQLQSVLQKRTKQWLTEAHS